MKKKTRKFVNNTIKHPGTPDFFGLLQWSLATECHLYDGSFCTFIRRFRPFDSPWIFCPLPNCHTEREDLWRLKRRMLHTPEQEKLGITARERQKPAKLGRYRPNWPKQAAQKSDEEKEDQGRTNERKKRCRAQKGKKERYNPQGDNHSRQISDSQNLILEDLHRHRVSHSILLDQDRIKLWNGLYGHPVLPHLLSCLAHLSSSDPGRGRDSQTQQPKPMLFSTMAVTDLPNGPRDQDQRALARSFAHRTTFKLWRRTDITQTHG